MSLQVSKIIREESARGQKRELIAEPMVRETAVGDKECVFVDAHVALH